MKKKYLIVGRDSFLSKNIIDLLIHKKITYYSTTRRKNISNNSIYLDLCNKNSQIELDKLNKIINEVDIIIFNIAFVGGVLFNSNSKIKLSDHVSPLIEFINILNEKKISKRNLKFIFISSACVYPPFKKNIYYSEEMGDKNLPDRSNFIYAISKRVMENICKSISNNKNINYLILRPFNFYGPYDNFDEYKGHVISSLIKKFDNFIKSNKTIKILGDLNSTRNFVYISDVAKIVLKLAENDRCTNTTINIGSELSYSIKNIKDELLNIYNKKTNKKIIVSNSKSIGVAQKFRSCNTKLLRKYIGKNFKFIPLNEGISKTVDYFDKLND